MSSHKNNNLLYKSFFVLLPIRIKTVQKYTENLKNFEELKQSILKEAFENEEFV